MRVLQNRRSKRMQRGFAMIAMILLVMLMSAYMIANGLSRTTAEVNIERDHRTLDALRQAKTALIAYAASEQWQLYKSESTKQPGALPCPDGNDNGSADGLCSNALSRVGRLPWKTLGVEDLRDASGERLWYAVSSNFRKLWGTTVINSDTKGLLTVTGTAPASDVVAIVFAPGAAIQGQSRPANPADPAHNNPSNYLEGFTTGANDYTFTTNALTSDTFNDRLIVITQADLMASVEPVVAARIERDVKPYLTTYFAEWGAFPFPSTFANPDPGTSGAATTRAQSAYAGGTTETSGLLPVATPVAYPWNFISSPSKVSGTGRVDPGGKCTTVVLPGWQCTFTVRGQNPLNRIANLRVRVEGVVGANAGISFAKLADVASIVTKIDGNGSAFTSVQYKGSLTSAGVGTVSYEATLPITCSNPSNPCPTYTIEITIPDVTVSKLTTTDEAQNPAYWFIGNEWYRQTYYAISPGYLPGAGASCATNCLTVNKLTSPTNKHSILVLAGRSFNGSARPSPSLANYLEGENATPSDLIFEHRAGTPTTINDRVVVVSP